MSYAKASMSGMGSSPLTRGKPEQQATVGVLQGLIPAHAGKTPRRHASAPSSEAHPRSRGENTGKLMNGVTQRGSSPLTRGKRLEAAVVLLVLRLIPAHAGKTRGACPCRGSVRAHPRSRGENTLRTLHQGAGQGSSPLTRGKPPRRRGRPTRARLIPAHAGKTSGRSGRGQCPWAHPRSRGENFAPYRARSRRGGSSPLTRGKQRATVSHAAASGLIPAHAGKTHHGRSRRHPGEAHPRSRGENQDENIINLSKQGSSPLTRGKPAEGYGRVWSDGLIPAHAGKTTSHGTTPRPPRAHPRSRGENPAKPTVLSRPTGSSPLTRGKL